MICYETRLSEFPEMQIFLNIYAECIWINISPSISHDEKNIRAVFYYPRHIIRYDDQALSFAEYRRRQINDTISSSSLNIQNGTNIIYHRRTIRPIARLERDVTFSICVTHSPVSRWVSRDIRDTMVMHCDVKMVSLKRVMESHEVSL